MFVTTQLKIDFFSLYIIEELDKDSIQAKLHLTDNQYFKLTKVAKNMDKTEITTELLEKIITRRLIANPCSENIKAAMEIWKYKHKIPITDKDEVDLSAIFNSETSVHS